MLDKVLPCFALPRIHHCTSFDAHHQARLFDIIKSHINQKDLALCHEFAQELIYAASSCSGEVDLARSVHRHVDERLPCSLAIALVLGVSALAVFHVTAETVFPFCLDLSPASRANCFLCASEMARAIFYMVCEFIG